MGGLIGIDPSEGEGGDITVTGVTGTVSVDGISPNLIDSNNSTSTPLTAGSTYTGTATDVSQFTIVTTSVKTDQDSASDGFKIEFSPDGTNWDDSSTFTLGRNVARRYQFPVTAQYYRVVLTNDSVDQTYLRIQTIAHRENTLYSIHKVDDSSETGDRTCQLVKSVLQAKIPNGDYTNIDATTGGNLKVSIEETDGNAFSNVTLDVTGTIEQVCCFIRNWCTK